MLLIHALFVLPFSSFCFADPWFVLHSVAPTAPTPPPEVTGSRQLERWRSSRQASFNDAWASYLDADPTKHAHADAEMLDFAATATWGDELPEWATETDDMGIFITETPAWFSELPKDVQSIKLEEGGVWASIVGESNGFAPKETARAAFGVLAGVAVAAVVM